MEKLIHDYSFSTSLLFWQFFILLGLMVSIWSIFILAKDKKESLGIKIIVFVSFFVIPLFSSVFYLIHYYSKKKSI